MVERSPQLVTRPIWRQKGAGSRQSLRAGGLGQQVDERSPPLRSAGGRHGQRR
jgi:hypothetical protein